MLGRMVLRIRRRGAAPLAACALSLWGAAALAAAGAVTGYVSDEGCAKAGKGLAPLCAQRCIAAGATAVLVTRAGKLYRVDDQERIAPWAGKVVSVSGEVRGRRVTRIDSVAEVRVTLRKGTPPRQRRGR